MSIYLDYSATAPLRPQVLEAMTPYLQRNFGNPSSIHTVGQAALTAVDAARREAAQILNCRPSEIVFTGSGTEADNLALKGLAFPKGHIIVSAIEHKAVLETVQYLESQQVAVSYVRPNKQGVVTSSAVAAAIRPDTFLISIMYANNEIGTIQPIAKIGQLISQLNLERDQKIFFHTDAVQAGTLLDLDTQRLRVDLLTLSAHKLGGPKGVGLLFVRDHLTLAPLLHGGGQERGLRSGTLNVSGIVGLTEALKLCQARRHKETARLKSLQAYVINELGKLSGVKINGHLHDRLVSNINFSVAGKSSDELVIDFDLKGIAVSAASACSSGSIEPSYVLRALGLSDDRASSSIRVSMGYATTKQDLTTFLKVLRQILNVRS